MTWNIVYADIFYGKKEMHVSKVAFFFAKENDIRKLTRQKLYCKFRLQICVCYCYWNRWRLLNTASLTRSCVLVMPLILKSTEMWNAKLVCKSTACDQIIFHMLIYNGPSRSISLHIPARKGCMYILRTSRFVSCFAKKPQEKCTFLNDSNLLGHQLIILSLRIYNIRGCRRTWYSYRS